MNHILRLALALALSLATVPPAALAQEVPAFVTLDQDKLFTASDFGQRVRETVEERARALGSENREIETALSEEERQLTEQRATLDPESFRALAEEFDRKVVEIRARQDRKAREIDAFAEDERTRFFQEVLPILVELLRESGAVAIIEDRAVVLAAEPMDITGTALRRVNDRLGTGAPPQDSPPPESAD